MLRKAHWLVLAVVILCGLSFTSCDEAKDALTDTLDELVGEICLDDLLDMVGMTREDLSETADAVLEEVLAAQVDILGKAYVIDCQAEETCASLGDPPADGPPPDDAEAPPTEDGESRSADSADEVAGQIRDIIDQRGGTGEEVALLLDATGSMWDDQAAVSSEFDSIMADVQSRGGKLAVAWYKDNYGCDSPWYASNSDGLLAMDVDANRTVISAFFSAIPVYGGCDWPESLYDGVVETIDGLAWSSTTARMIIAITDADALQPPASNHSEAQVQAALAAAGVTLHTINVAISY